MVQLLGKIIVESTLAVFGKVAFRAIMERFYTRLVIYGLEKLKERSENEVVDKTVDDIIASLKGKRLKVIDEIDPKA